MSKQAFNFVDLTGRVFNYLTVNKQAGKTKWGNILWECFCKCNAKKVVVSSGNLQSGHTQSCGCLMREKAREANFIDLTGKLFGRLLVIKYLYRKKNQTYYLCRCSCDNKERIVIASDLMSGSSKSCGCLKLELAKVRSLTHGFRKGSPLQQKFYSTFMGIKQRCLNPKDSSYPDYGGRNITICDKWLKAFENFRDDEWESFLRHVEEFGIENTSIERIDVDGNYEPSNCKWATDLEQARNKRNSVNTLNYSLHDYWHKKLGVVVSTVLRKHRTSGRRWKKGNIFEYYVGLTKLEFCQYIESQFESWMNWNNYGKGPGKWSLDHIKLVNQFDLSKEEDRLICWNYKNLRPYNDVSNNKEHRRDLVTA